MRNGSLLDYRLSALRRDFAPAARRGLARERDDEPAALLALSHRGARCGEEGGMRIAFGRNFSLTRR